MKIFVMIGSMYSFDRLIKQMDLIGKKHQVILQTGSSDYKPKNVLKWKKFFNQKEVEEYTLWADVVVCHAGVGTILELIRKEKKIVLFPRLKEFKEAVDDHQLEIAKAFNKKYDLKYTTNEKQLKNLIKKANKIKIKKENKLVKGIKRVIEDI